MQAEVRAREFKSTGNWTDEELLLAQGQQPARVQGVRLALDEAGGRLIEGNRQDRHGRTSHLSADQIRDLAHYVLSL